jgi:hypothetical protein
VGCDDLVMGDCEVAQAVELTRALRDQLREMTAQLTRVERQVLRVTPWSRRARAMRLEAAELRRDMQEAQALIDRLQRRYLNGDERTTSTWTAAPRAMAGRQAK